MADTAIKPARQAENELRTKDLTAKLEAGIKELFSSDKYKDYLKSMSKFYSYSSRNIMLIHQQMPNATRVASYKLWHEKFNRQVKKGEKSLRIFAPIEIKPEKKMMEKLDPETGAAMLDNDGKIIMEEMTSTPKRNVAFKLVPVFDVSQTYGEPLPKLAEDLQGNVQHYEAFLDTLKTVAPLPIEFEAMEENLDGYCQYGVKIAIREGMSEIQTISAIIHEITHANLHDSKKSADDEKATPKEVKEIEAESVSYVVCQKYGIETGTNSFGYLATWSTQDLNNFKASLDIVRKEANTLINAIDDSFKAICRERGIDLSATEQTAEITPPTQTAETPAEPIYTTETTTETIAGVEFTVNEVLPTAETTVAHDPPPPPWEKEFMPDPSISIGDRDEYGYIYDDMLPLKFIRAEELYNQDHTIFMLYEDGTEAMAYDVDEMKAHGGIYGIEREDWQKSQEYRDNENNVNPQQEAAVESDFINAKEDSFAIYQIMDGVEKTRDVRFEGLNSLEQRGLEVNRNNYVIVHTEPLAPETTLDSIYQKFNIDHPNDFAGHSLSVSDVIVFNQGGEITSHFVDSIGFSQLPAFLGVEKQAEIATPVEHGSQEQAKTPTGQPSIEIPDQPKSEQPIYRQSADYALEKDELQAWRDSRDVNVECGKAIDKAITASNYKEYHFDLNTAARAVMAEFGAERVAWVLAGNVNDSVSDTRLSRSNRDWASGFDTPKPDIHLQSHKILIDGFADSFRKVEKEKPSLMTALAAGEKKSETEFNGKAQPKLEAHEKSKKNTGMEV